MTLSINAKHESSRLFVAHSDFASGRAKLLLSIVSTVPVHVLI